MRVLVDADGCPVIRDVISIAGKEDVPVTLVCDTEHDYGKYPVKTVTVSRGSDSADLAIANSAGPGDVVVTQDYGLAALCIAKGSIPINQDGIVFTEDNIDSFLMARHLAKKARSAGERLKGPSKRTGEQTREFCRRFSALLDSLLKNRDGSAV